MFQRPSARWTRLTLGSSSEMRENSTAPEGRDAQGDADAACLNDGFGAEGGVFRDHEVFQGEARHGQQGESDGVDVDGPAEGLADALGDAAAEAVGADERRQEDEADEQQEDGDDHEDAAALGQDDGPRAEVFGVDLEVAGEIGVEGGGFFGAILRLVLHVDHFLFKGGIGVRGRAEALCYFLLLLAAPCYALLPLDTPGARGGRRGKGRS